MVQLFCQPFDFVGFGGNCLPQFIVFGAQTLEQSHKVSQLFFEVLDFGFHLPNVAEKALLGQWLSKQSEGFVLNCEQGTDISQKMIDAVRMIKQDNYFKKTIFLKRNEF